MIKDFAHSYFSTGQYLTEAKLAVQKWRASNPAREFIPGDMFEVDWSLKVLGMARGFAESLSLPTFVSEINRSIEYHKNACVAARLEFDLDRVTARFYEELKAYHFKFVPPPLFPFYGREKLFGDLVYDKFPEARADIRAAGNCYALEEPTASVFHVMRSMEVAVRHIGRRIGITLSPQITWRVITGGMDAKIKAFPEKTSAQRDKKDAWAEARANLHHVGQVWRNKTMHPAVSYTQPQARDVLDASRVSMISLVNL